MRAIGYITIGFTLISLYTLAQPEKKAIRQGNREFNRNQFLESEISYRKALEKNASSFKGNFNLADALYKQEKFEEANSLLDGLSSVNLTDNEKAKVYHNLGNTLLKQQKVKEGIEAYKNSLKLNPNDRETKYNLSEALRMLKQQQQQQQQNKDNKDNKDNKQNKDQKDQDKKDDQKKDQNKDKQKDQDKQNQDQKEKQQQKQKISPEDARRMLEAIQNNEKLVQQKVKDQKAKAAKVKVEKNW